MIERIIAFSIRRRGLVIATAIVFAVASIYAAVNTPIDAIPDLSENQVIVFADWLSHGPREIEDQITYPLSQALQGIGGVRVVRGSSEFNFSMLSVIFNDRVGVEQARRQVAQKLAAASHDLPPGVSAYLAPESPATGQIYWYTLEGVGYDLGQLRSIQDWYVCGQLAAVDGVAEVASVGGMPIEYQIEIDPEKLAKYDITLGMVLREVARANAGIGGHVVQQAGSEYVVRGSSIGEDAGKDGGFASERAISDLENVVLRSQPESVRLLQVARVSLAPGPRRGVLEKDGNEVTGGVISIRYGENPLQVAQRIREKIDQLQSGLPTGVRIVTVYDRTPLIHGAIRTLTGTLLEAIIGAGICVLIVLLHVRTTFVIAVTLPLAVLGAFLGIWLLDSLGIASIQTNVMSLAGIAVSIGVLVDVSIVMAENAMHMLKLQFGNRPVTGDTRATVALACRTIGRPIFFSVLIMLLSFLPVFALEGAEGKMFRPLATTKSLALLGAAILAITLVPALCTVFIRGRLRDERDSRLVRSVMDIYRPVLEYCLARPGALVWFLCITCVVAAAPIGSPLLLRGVLLLALLATGLVMHSSLGKIAGLASLVLIGLFADARMQKLEFGAMVPLDEQMVMDMPISAPRASIAQSTDDLKARDMVLCRFPEVEMVVGKAGRAETATDPAPMYMIETMVGFRPVTLWPARKLSDDAARAQTAAVLKVLLERKLIQSPLSAAQSTQLIATATSAAQARFDANMREIAFQSNQQFARDLARQMIATIVRAIVTDQSAAEMLANQAPQDLVVRFYTDPQKVDVTDLVRFVMRLLPEGSAHNDVSEQALLAAVRSKFASTWRQHIRTLNVELVERAGVLYTRIVLEELLCSGPVANEQLKQTMVALDDWRWNPPPVESLSEDAPLAPAAHHAARKTAPPPRHQWQPTLDAVVRESSAPFEARLVLWRAERAALTGTGGELDLAVQMPGWGNVWTMPIQNRVDMLATGVNTPLGVRVLGRHLEDVVSASEEIAATLNRVLGPKSAAADPIRGKGYLDVDIDRQRAAELGVNVGDINQTVETAIGGSVATTIVAGRERFPVRLRYGRPWRDGVDVVRRLQVPAGSASVSLEDVATVDIVEGPATIKSENGLLRNYVRVNVPSMSLSELVPLAQHAIAEQVMLPSGVYLEWTGQYEYELRARRTLLWMMPLVIGLIFALLYWIYRDPADAALMLLAVPGALAGGVLFQWLCGYPFSVTVLVGYVSCFGMAASTSVVMLVYLRDSLERAGGLAGVDLAGLRTAVVNGAVQRLRPKLLTEGTTIIGLAPMLWSTGVGAEVIRPMAAPVLGGILVADEVIDLLLPVLFYHVRRWRWLRLHAKQNVANANDKEGQVHLFDDAPVAAG